MYSTVLTPDPNMGKYSPITSHNGKSICGVAFPSAKADWLENIYNHHQQNPNDVAVYWAKKITGIVTHAKKAVVPGIGIKVNGMISGTGSHLVGIVQDVIIPSTTVKDLCSLYSNGNLGINPLSNNVLQDICNFLDMAPTDCCIGYVININKITIGRTIRTNQTGIYY